MPKTTRPFHSILCPVDFSEDSKAALRHAATLARLSGGQLTVMFVNDPLLVAAAAAVYDKHTLADATEEELSRFVVTSVGPKDAPAVDTLVVIGDPSKEIAKAARRLGADLVVVGTRGLGRGRTLFFGSTTERVLRHAKVSTLVVPRTEGKKAPVRAWPSRALAACAPGREAAADVRGATAVARSLSARLSIVTVVEPAQVPSWLSLRPAQSERQRLSEARTKFEILARRSGHKNTAVHVLAGRPADQIASAAVANGADIIILNLRASDHLTGPRQGSVTYRVVCRSAIPVLALAGRPRSPR